MSELIDAYANRLDCVQDAWVEVSAAAGFYRGKNLTNAPVAGTGKLGDMDLSAPFFMVSAVHYGSSATVVRPVAV